MLSSSNQSEQEPLLSNVKDDFSSSKYNKWYTPKTVGIAILLILLTASFASFTVLHPAAHSKSNIQKFEQQWVQLESVDRTKQSPDWTPGDLCDDDTTFQMTIALAQQNTDKLDALLLEVSDPKSSKYGQFYSQQEVEAMFAPTKETINAVQEWLDHYELKQSAKFVSPNQDFISFQVTCKLANKMLNTKYSQWGNEKTGAKHFRVLENYYIPPYLQEHIDLVSPTLRFPAKSHIAARHFLSKEKDFDHDTMVQKLNQIDRFIPGPGRGKDDPTLSKISDNDSPPNKKVKPRLNDISQYDSSDASTDFSYVSPAILQKLYLVTDYVDSAAGDSTNKQAIGSWLEEYYTDDDLAAFDKAFDISSNTYERVPADQEQGYGAEATLDVQYIGSTGVDIYTQVYYTDDESGHWILSFINTLRSLSDNERPNVVSMSYGASESGSGDKLCERANSHFGQLSLLGMTFFASSGDSGAAGDSSSCSSGYEPSFPASCPYVTAVGGTHAGSYVSSVSDDTGELAWYYGGGGFSTLWDRPAWQSAAVEGYLGSGVMPDSSLYAAGGRGYPDIAAQSVDYVIRYESGWYTVSGTSCSSPTVAGMFSMINDLRIQSGKSALGFLNPALYALYDEGGTTYFNDVVSGYNVGCEDDDYVGFSSAAGWDATTGVGTPKFSQIAEALLKY